MAPHGGWRDWAAWGMDDATLMSRTRRRSQLVPGLFDLAPAAASEALGRELRSIFVPSVQTNAIIRLLLGTTEEHLRACYPDMPAYLRGLNAARSPMKPVDALCLTGLGPVNTTAVHPRSARS